jgi:uncharacterized protein YoxC
MYLQIGLVILGIVFFVLMIFCMYVLLQIRQAAKDISVTLETLNRHLPSILGNIEEITTNISCSVAAINREVQSFTDTAERVNLVVKNVADDLRDIVPVVMKSNIFQTVKKVFAVVKGIRVFVDEFLAKR